MQDISKDVTGILAEDNKTVHAPLKDKSPHEVHAAHNKPGTPVKDQCQCAHCAEHRALGVEKAPDPLAEIKTALSSLESAVSSLASQVKVWGLAVEALTTRVVNLESDTQKTI